MNDSTLSKKDGINELLYYLEKEVNVSRSFMSPDRDANHYSPIKRYQDPSNGSIDIENLEKFLKNSSFSFEDLNGKFFHQEHQDNTILIEGNEKKEEDSFLFKGPSFFNNESIVRNDGQRINIEEMSQDDVSMINQAFILNRSKVYDKNDDTYFSHIERILENIDDSRFDADDFKNLNLSLEEEIMKVENLETLTEPQKKIVEKIKKKKRTSCSIY